MSRLDRGLLLDSLKDAGQTHTMPSAAPQKALSFGPIVTLDSNAQLPLWPRDQRALPNAIARSALFNTASARKGGEREFHRKREIAALKGISITYTGEELRQDDEDVFLQCLHLARMQGLGTEVYFTANSMLTDLRWTGNGPSYLRLADTLYRLTVATVGITVESGKAGRENYTGSLIGGFQWRDGEGGPPLRQWHIQINPQIASLFDPASHLRLNWQARLKLTPLEKWLHTFYHSHAQPFAYKVETLHRLTDSEIVDLRKFRYKLRKALESLVEKGFLLSSHIDAKTDLVHVVRKHQIEA